MKSVHDSRAGERIEYRHNRLTYYCYSLRHQDAVSAGGSLSGDAFYRDDGAWRSRWSRTHISTESLSAASLRDSTPSSNTVSAYCRGIQSWTCVSFGAQVLHRSGGGYGARKSRLQRLYYGRAYSKCKILTVAAP
jgi:hypothetical protein